MRHSRVDLLWLTDHDGLVFEVVVDDDLSHSGVLETALNDVLFEVTGELQDLSIINKLEIRSSEGPPVHIKRALQLQQHSSTTTIISIVCRSNDSSKISVGPS